MSMSNLKLTAALLAVALSGAAPGSGLFGGQPRAQGPSGRADDGPAKPPRDEAPRADALGDPLPQGARARLGTARLRHGRDVFCGEFSRDGKLFAAAELHEGGTLHVWDVSTGKAVLSVPRPDGIAGVAFAPDDRTLMTVGRPPDNFLRHWDLKTGREVRRLRMPGGAHGSAFTADGKTFVWSEADNALHVCDAVNCKELRDLDGAKELREGELTVSPGGTRVVRTGVEGFLYVFDLKSGERTQVLRRDRFSPGSPLCMDFSPDGSTLAAGYSDGTVALWGVADGTQLRQVDAHKGVLHSVRFSPDGKTIATSSSSENDFALWDVKGKLRHRPGAGQYLVMGFSPDGKTVASAGADNAVRFWDVGRGEEVVPFGKRPPAVRAAAASADGKLLATTDHDTVSVWDVARGREVVRIRSGQTVLHGGVALSPDGKSVAAGLFDRSVCVWDAATGEPRGRFPLKDTWPAGVAFSADGKTLIVGGQDNCVRFLSIATGEEVRTIKLPEEVRGELLGLQLLAGGKTLVTASCRPHGEGAFCLWNVENGEEVRRVTAERFPLRSFAASADGKTLATGEEGGMIRLWDATTGRQVGQLRGQPKGAVGLALTADGTGLASVAADGTTRLWDVKTREVVRTWPAQPGLGAAVLFTPDGGTLLSIGTEGSALLWDTARLRPRGDPPGSR
jgi:WD40 repeat protein